MKKREKRLHFAGLRVIFHDYNGDQKDDLLVRQYSTCMLGYYASGDTTNWNVLGYGVSMEWTVIT